MKELWTNETPAFDGDYVRFADLSFAPKPVQKPHPPIWIGGESAPALRRTVRLADGWYPIGNNPRHPMNTAERCADGVATLHRFAEEAGRDPADIDIAFFVPRYNEAEAVSLDDGTRQAFTGSPADIAADIARFGELGVRHLIFSFLAPSLEATQERMAFFASEVRPLLGD
jgi:alkanesulfonate monooxygenase SsuD/methylene tetrahydromethanopterin reductase-like flavin-dependent oxidoreductase (luciferase family)